MSQGRPPDTAAALPDWGAEALAQALQPLLPGLSVQVVAEIGSTNTELVARARSRPDTPPTPTLLVAEQQTAGRGRQGKVWQSAAGRSLTFSLAMPLAPADWSGLSLAVGLSLAEALDPAPAVPALGLKWPNDLLLLDDGGRAPHIGRKLGGILIETVPAGGQRLAVIGIGLNIRPLPAAGGEGTAPGWGQACLHERWPGLSAPGLLARLASPLLRDLLAFERDGFAPLQAHYARRDVLAGRAVQTTLPALPQGVADGVDGSGVLWLYSGGARHPVASGEVSLRPVPTVPPAAGAPAC